MGSPEPQEMGNETAAPKKPLKADSPPPVPPSPPDPSTDPGVVPPIASPPPDDGTLPGDQDIFVLSPVAALKLLCTSVDSLVKFTGDIPATPPVRSRNTSPTNSASRGTRSRSGSKENLGFAVERKEVPETAIISPEVHHIEPLHIIGAHAKPVYIQQGAIARKFYSKRPPPISTEAYLMRMHRYCPMSTAVYLATSLYIHRLAVIEKIISVTPRNVHRLLLAGLRVAMKALEDLSYPHSRFAKVGGVSEVELGRLEITFCFLTNFELKVDAGMLSEEASSLREGGAIREISASLEMTLPKGEKRKASSALPTRPIIPPVGATS